jgi:hypothetical protein
MSNESENKRIDLDAIAARLLQQPSRITNYRRIRTKEFEDIIAELKRCYEELDALRIGLNMAHKCLADHNFRQCHECGDHYHDDYGPLCGHTASE